jgi:hypothetical protein
VPVPGDELSPGGYGNVRDVEVVSATDAWLVSDFGYESFNQGHVYRWGGQRWEEIPFPAPETGSVESWVLDDIEVVSPTEAWVVGSRTIDQTRVVRPIVGRWDGTRWRLVRLGLRPRIAGELNGIVHVPGTDDLVAVGAWSRRSHPRANDLTALILRWTGSRWQRVWGTDVGRWSALRDVVVARSSVWAIGTGRRPGERARLLALRWTPHGWLPRWRPRGGARAADAGSGGAIWVSGSTSRGGRGVGMLARLDPDRGWGSSRVVRAVDVLDDVVVSGPHLVWAVGSRFIHRWNAPRGVIVRGGPTGWRTERRSQGPGYFSAIGGTPNNLWTFLSYPPVESAELWRFTSFHRC